MDAAEIEALLDVIAVHAELHRQVPRPCSDPFSLEACPTDGNLLGQWRRWVRR